MTRKLIAGSARAIRRALLGGLILTSGVSVRAAGSDASDLPTIDDLRAPAAPGFELLGIAPSVISRPESPRALITSIASSVSSSEGFPKDYALQVTPYWLTSHPDLTFEKYLKPSTSQTLARTLSLSMATAKVTAKPSSASTADTADTALSLGTRGLIKSGNANPHLDTLVQELKTKHDTMHEILKKGREEESHLVKIKDEWKARRAEADRSKDPLEALRLDRESHGLELEMQEIQDGVKALDGQFAKAKEAARSTALEIQKADAEPTGLVIGYAGAVVWNFPAESFTDRQVFKAGAWLTPSYRVARCEKTEKTDGEGENDPGGPPPVAPVPTATPTPAPACRPVLELMGVGRYLQERNAGELVGRWDLGARILWHAGRDFALSAEYVRRSKSSGDAAKVGVAGSADHRLVGVAEARLSDGTFAYASVGRDFSEKGARQNLVSIVGVTLGFEGKPVLLR